MWRDFFVHHIAGSPRLRHPDTAKCAVVLEAVKDGTFGGALTRPSLTASARAGSPICVGRGEETGFQIKQGN
jgi:hypothetical protein